MTNHQDHDTARVIPFAPHLRRKRSNRSSDDTAIHTSLMLDSESADRIVNIDSAIGPIPGEEDGVEHIAALPLAVSSGAFFPHIPTEDTPAAAAALGFTQLEIMLQTAGEYDPEFAQLVAANAEAAGVRIRSVHTWESFHPVLSNYPRRAEEGRAMMSKGIEFARIVGAEILVWHGPDRAKVHSPEGWPHFIDTCLEIAAECSSKGITLALENVGRSALGHVRDVTAFAKILAERDPEETVGFVFDPFQAAEASANPFMMLAAMGNRVVNVHISDWLEHDPNQRHLPPGDGDLPWPALTRAIASSGYDGPLVIEGSLGISDEIANRVRAFLEPLVRSVFSYPPGNGNRARRPAPPEELPLGVRQGIQLFNQRRFYEQHEVIEHEWHAESTDVRTLYQGLLQIGVGFHHALSGNHKGAMSLLNDGTEKVQQFTPIALGIDTARLVRETNACIEQLSALGEHNIRAFEAELIPQIHLLG